MNVLTWSDLIGALALGLIVLYVLVVISFFAITALKKAKENQKLIADRESELGKIRKK